MPESRSFSNRRLYTISYMQLPNKWSLTIAGAKLTLISCNQFESFRFDIGRKIKLIHKMKSSLLAGLATLSGFS